MFNDDSSDLNVLVASDAIGMGLNLNIYRIIFSTMMKFDGFSNRELTVAEIKQIAGITFASYWFYLRQFSSLLLVSACCTVPLSSRLGTFCTKCMV